MRTRIHGHRPLNWLILIVIHGLTNHGTAQLTHQSNSERTSIFENGQHVLTYNAAHLSKDGKWPRANYVHPLVNPLGEVITEDFPADHPHHRGIFWAWHQLWLLDKQLGDAWACEGFQWNPRSSRTYHTQEMIVIANELTWSALDRTELIQSSTAAHAAMDPTITGKSTSEFNSQKVEYVDVIDEQNWIYVHSATENIRVIDFFITLAAKQDGVRIGGSEDAKGYGGFSVRLELDGSEVFQSNEQDITPHTQAITAGHWLDISRQNSGLAIINHSGNPGLQQDRADWILRRRNSMQNAVYPGQHPVLIPKDQPLQFGYRLVLHDGTVESEQLRQLSVAFEKVLPPWSMNSQYNLDVRTRRTRPVQSWLQKRFHSGVKSTAD